MEIDLTTSYVGILSLIVFILAYAVVMAEEFSHLRKSKPVIISAALIWGIIAFHFSSNKEIAYAIEHALEHNILEFSETDKYNSSLLKLKSIKYFFMYSSLIVSLTLVFAI